MDETEEVQWTDDEHAIVELLRSMGVTKFDSSVPAALNEYAKRYASELLTDAKDYSVYESKKEITVDDVRLALKLSDSRITGIDANVNAVEELKEEINKHSLESLLDKAPISIRSLPLLGTQRPFTMIPGSEAYSNYAVIGNHSNSSSSAMDV